MLRQVRKIAAGHDVTPGRDTSPGHTPSGHIPPDHIPTGDELLNTFARTGSPADFEQIVRRFAAIVLMECRKVTRNPHDAEDASQLTFLALAMELKLGKKILHPSAWLQRVARNQSIKIIRSGSRRTRRENVVRKNDFVPNNEMSLDASHNSGIIRDEIDQLPDRYRLPLVLHYFGGMSMEMISREMQIGKQTVGTRLHRARKMLGTKLSGHGIQLDATLLSNLLGIVIPGAVIASIVRATTSPVTMGAALGQATLGHATLAHATLAQATSGLPASMGYFINATTISVTKKAIRAALLTAAIGVAGTAVANKLAPGLFKLPQMQLPNVFEWLNRAPQLLPKWSLTSSQGAAVSIASPQDKRAAGANSLGMNVAKSGHRQSGAGLHSLNSLDESANGFTRQQDAVALGLSASSGDRIFQEYGSEVNSNDIATNWAVSGYQRVFNYFALSLPANTAAFYQTGGDMALSLASTNPVPEPAIALPLTAGAGLLISRRRRREMSATAGCQRS